MNRDLYFFDVLYPLQDRVLGVLRGLDTLFYLSGGTAAEPKDLADVWGFCCRLGLPLAAAIEGAGSKAAGIFPADVARRLCVVTRDDWKLVRWIEPPDPERYVSDLVELGEKLIL